MVELYYGSKTDLVNSVAFPMATMKLQTVKGGSSIKNLSSSLTLSGLSGCIFVIVQAIHTLKGSK